MSDQPHVAGPFHQRHPRAIVYALIGVALTTWLLVDVQRRGRVDPSRPSVHRTDFTCFTEGGAAFFDGRDPYEVTNPRGWGYCYAPMFALLVAPLHALDPQVQVSIWFAISVLCAWGCYRECARLFQAINEPIEGCHALARLGMLDSTRKPGSMPSLQWIPWAAATVAVLPIFNGLQRGQVEVLKLYLLLLGFRLVLTGQRGFAWFAGGVALSAAIVLKLTPILPVGFLILLLLARCLYRAPGDKPALLRASAVSFGTLAGGLMLVFIIPAGIIGWNANWHHLGRFHEEKIAKVNDYRRADRTGDTQTVRNQSLSNAVIRLGNFIAYDLVGQDDAHAKKTAVNDAPPTIMESSGVARVLLAARLTMIALLIAAGYCAVRRGDALAQAACIAMACVVALVVSPISRGFYFAELAPAVLILPVWLSHRGMHGTARVMAWTPVVLVILHYTLLSIAGRIGLLGIGTTVWCATGLSILIIGGRLAPRVIHLGDSRAATAGSLSGPLRTRRSRAATSHSMT